MASPHALTLALGGKWYGSHGMARCPAHDDRSPSLSITQGRQCVLLHCFAGCEYRDIVSAIEGARLGWTVTSGDNHASARRQDKHSTAVRSYARDLWHFARHDPDVISTYLGARGIDIGIPPTLRFCPALHHSPSGSTLPAMIAAIQSHDDQIVAVQRTFLAPDHASKATVTPPRMTLGPVGSGAVRLGAVSEAMVLGEGIETTLSGMQLSGLPGWAAIGARLHAVILPQSVREVHILVDNDRAGLAAADVAADTLVGQGRRVILRHPPEKFGDWNEALTGRIAA